MSNTIKITSHWTDALLFEHECDDNTIKKTLETAAGERADLRGADLRGADLQRADNADLAIAMTRILPEGDIIGYKKCQDDVIVKLLIPKDSKRSHAFGRKFRAEYAEVLEITDPDGGTEATAISNYNTDFIYKVGETVRPTDIFEEDWTEECASGIHFYITRAEAEAN
jgi:hypothetical protein